MVTRLFSSKSSSGGGSQASSKRAQQQPPPPPPPAFHKPKLSFSSIGKPPRRQRPTNLPLCNTPSTSPPRVPQHSSKTPPASTFRNAGLPSPSHQAALGAEEQGRGYYEDGGAGYLDHLTRARSDESLLWTAEEEASALVAELRASLNCSNGTNASNINNAASDNSINTAGRLLTSTHQYRPHHYQHRDTFNPYLLKTNTAPLANGSGYPPMRGYSDSSTAQQGSMLPPQVNPFQRSFSVHRRTSEARIAAQKLNESTTSSGHPHRSRSFTDLQSAVELVPLHPHQAKPSPNSKPPHIGGPGLPMKTFGGSWKSLLRGECG